MSDQKVENITVSVRIRPLNERELSSGDTCAWQTENNNSIKEISGTRNFLYDKVYNKDVDTREIFYCQGIEVIEKAISGYNGCIFCYGQTGSGKTYTMHGCKKTNPGIVPLSIDHIFLIIEKSPNKEFLIRCSYIEIYNESVNDLLNPSSLNLQLAEDKKSGIKIIGVTEKVCTSAHQVYSLLALGEKHKNIASTNFNQRSSRAHNMYGLFRFRVIVESKNIEGRAEVAIATLNLIDLAGSESADVHGPASSTARSKEMKYINRSLLTLGTVIMRLSDTKNNAPIPYRDSKLTRLLQPALEGDSKVSIICNISSCSQAYDETLSTLKFAQRAKKIKQVLIKNDVNDSKALIVKYQNEIHQLQEKLREMEIKMTHEEANITSSIVNNQLILLQEEKEIADARLEGILQEKIKLQEDLERLKSFIIHADDVKLSKSVYNEIEEKHKKDTGDLHHSKTSYKIRVVSPDYNSDDNYKIPNLPYLSRFENLLTKDIDNIEEELDSGDIMSKISVLTPSLTMDECLQLIDEQAKTIEDLKKKAYDKDKILKVIKEQNDVIESMKKTIKEKEEQYELFINNRLLIPVYSRPPVLKCGPWGRLPPSVLLNFFFNFHIRPSWPLFGPQSSPYLALLPLIRPSWPLFDSQFGPYLVLNLTHKHSGI